MNTVIRRTAFGISMLVLAAGTTAGVPAQELTFGYIPASMSYPYNVATAAGFEEAAAAAGVAAVVLDPQGEVERQGNSIDDLIAQGVDGIGFLPLDSVVAEGFADRISEAGIPVAAVAVQVGDPATREFADIYPSLNAFVAPDDVIMGKRAGELARTLLTDLGHPAKIAIIEGAPGYATVDQRTKGFKDALDAAGIEYEVIGSQPTDWTPERGEAVCQNFLTTNPDIDLFYSQADDMAIGCARALDATGSEAKLIATSGGSALGNAAIAAGELDGSVCMRPKLLGELMFKVLHDAATGVNTAKAQFVTLELPIITKDNLDT
jgi:ribose transport system substrate-binding protein